MAKKTRTLDELIANMRSVGDQLISYNFPQADPKLEDDLNIVKTKEALVDGYQVVLHYSKADYKTHFVETVQIVGKLNPFLPFALVAKIGRKFLGNAHLCLTEFLKDNRKIYCWSVCLDRRGRPIHNTRSKLTPLTFEGFAYNFVEASQMRFY